MHKILRQARELSFSSSGQVGLTIILIMTVLMTVGLSVASRSSRELSLSTQEKESVRVFNAAETGINEALSKIAGGDFNSGSISGLGDSDVNYQISGQNALETKIFEGLSSNIDLTGASAGNNLRIDWSKETNCSSQDPASIVVSIFYDDAGVTKVRHLAYEGCSHADGFTVTGAGSSPYFKSATIALTSNDLFAHVKAVYNDTHIKVSGSGWTLPTQSYVVRSEATSNLGNETRIVEVNKSLDSAPSLMDYALLSGSTIIK